MPYKDPERKRQWEREHRQQRNAQRKQRRLEPQRNSAGYQQMHEPAPVKDSRSGWKLFLGLAVGIGVILLAVAGMGSPTQLSRHTVGWTRFSNGVGSTIFLNRLGCDSSVS